MNKKPLLGDLIPMPKISVIVPVYNVEKYIKRCIDSILNQTFNEFELILVDDGSPDNCGAICDEYAKRDNRVHVIHQKNGGLSAARNSGIAWALEKSDSEWISFIDSDDWVHPDYLLFLYKAVMETNLNVGLCKLKIVNGINDFNKENGDYYSISPQDLLYKDRGNTVAACGKLYKKHDFTSTFFPVGKLHEDEFTTYKVIFRYQKIAFVNSNLYYYYVNPLSITQSKWSLRRLDVLSAFTEQLCFFKNKHYTKAFSSTARVLMFGYANAVVNLRNFYPRKVRLRVKYHFLFVCCKLRGFGRFLLSKEKENIRFMVTPKLANTRKWFKKKKSNAIELLKGKK